MTMEMSCLEFERRAWEISSEALKPKSCTLTALLVSSFSPPELLLVCLFSMFCGVSCLSFLRSHLINHRLSVVSAGKAMTTLMVVFLQLFFFLGNLVPVAPSVASDLVCKVVNCGFGNCTQGSILIPFKCVCYPGWKQIEVGPILLPPCVLPNCTLDFNCGNFAPSPPPRAPPVFNLTDPCSYTFCGEGNCVRTGGTGYRCDCYKGAANFQNMTSLPCFEECTYGSDCSALGIGLTPSPPPTLPPDCRSPQHRGGLRPLVPALPPAAYSSNSGQNVSRKEKLSVSEQMLVMPTLALVAMFI